MSCDYEPRLIA